jgi:hypothetical protein
MNTEEKLGRIEMYQAVTIFNMLINSAEKNAMFHDYFQLLEEFTEGECYETHVQDRKIKAVLKHLVMSGKI